MSSLLSPSSSPSDRKTIIINPNLFSLNTTRKKNKPDKSIKIRNTVEAENRHNRTTRQKIISSIRKQQQENYKKMIEEYNRKIGGNNNDNDNMRSRGINNIDLDKEPALSASAAPQSSSAEFKQSLEFLKSSVSANATKDAELASSSPLAEHRLKYYHKMDEEAKKRAHSSTLKISPLSKSDLENRGISISPAAAAIAASVKSDQMSLSNHNPDSQHLQEYITGVGVGAGVSSFNNENGTPLILSSNNNNVLPPPQYGVLKNGDLPTYRAYYNKTQKIRPVQINDEKNMFQPHNNIFAINNNSLKSPPPPAKNLHLAGLHNHAHNQPHTQHPQLTPKQEFMQNQINKPLKKKLQNQYQRKTAKRTFHVGKSKYTPRVGVLVSNKTIRKNVETKLHDLKKTPIEDVRNYLIKRGLIKIGSVSPEDVLRKIYESSVMIDGEIQNHNKEITLHNYFLGAEHSK